MKMTLQKLMIIAIIWFSILLADVEFENIWMGGMPTIILFALMLSVHNICHIVSTLSCKDKAPNNY